MLNKSNNIKIKSSYNSIARFGLWCLLLSATISNAIDVLSILFAGTSFPELRTIVQVITIIITAIMLLSMVKTQWKLMFISLSLFAGIWYLSALYNSDAAPFIKENISSFFFEALPYLWVFNYFIQTDIKKQHNIFFQLLYKICRVKLIIVLLTQFIMFVAPQTDIFHDYMNAANAMLLGLVVLTAKNMSDYHKVLFNDLLEFTTVLFIIILGSRGGLLCYASFYILYFLFIADVKKTAILTLAILTFVFLYFWGPSIISSFAGSDNRLLSLYSSKELVHDESRELIAGIIFGNIVDHPWGLGVMADRAILTSSNEIWEVFYTHNLELEMGINFGYFGLLLSVVLLITIIYYLHSSYDKYIRMTYLTLVSCSIVKLQVSSSYWKDPMFWAVMGILLAMVVNYKYVKIR